MCFIEKVTSLTARKGREAEGEGRLMARKGRQAEGGGRVIARKRREARGRKKCHG